MQHSNELTQHDAGSSPASRERVRRWGAVLWPSFLVAGIATMVFFANLDPEELRAATFPQLELSRKFGYTLGFFMFWAVTAWSSFLTLFLLEPSSGRPAANTGAAHDVRR